MRPVKSHPDVLAEAPFLVRNARSGTHQVVADALSRADVSPAGTIEANRTESIKWLVAAGYGIAVISLTAARDQIVLGAVEGVEITGLGDLPHSSRLA